jgi:hypothetical protein
MILLPQIGEKPEKYMDRTDQSNNGGVHQVSKFTIVQKSWSIL